MTCSSHELVVIDHHREPLGRVLSDKRLDDTECLARPRCSDYPCSTKTVGYILSLIHISEPTRLGMISYAVFCLKKKKTRCILYTSDGAEEHRI